MENLGINATAEQTNITTDEDPIAIKVFFSTFFVVTIVWGILGNLFIMGSVLAFKRLRNVTNVFVFNLAVADLMMTAFSMPVMLANILYGGLAYGQGLCTAVGFVMFLSAALSISNWIYIAFNRFVRVCWTEVTYSKIFRPRHTALMVVVSWVYCLLASGLPLVTNWTTVEYTEKGKYCGYNSDELPVALHIIGIGVIIPTSLILYFYFKIYLKIREIERDIRKQTTGERNPNDVKKRAIFTLFLIFILFVSFWFPYAVVLATEMATHVNKYIPRFTAYLGCSNSCINSTVLICRSRRKKISFRQKPKLSGGLR